MQSSFSRFAALLGRLLMSIVILVVLLVGLDLVSREFLTTETAFEQRFPGGYFRYPYPYIMFGGAPEAKFAPHNRLGYRGRAPREIKPPGQYRIFILGGSTVYGGAPSIPDVVQRVFRSQGHRHVTTFNFGVVSSVSGMDLARILFHVADLEPDMVVMYGGGNDTLVPFMYDPRPGYPFNYLVFENNPLLESDIADYPIGSLLAYGSNIARYFGAKHFADSLGGLSDLRDSAGWNTEPWRQEIATAYLDNLNRASKLSNGIRARFVAFFQPMLHFKKTLAPRELKFMDDALSGNLVHYAYPPEHSRRVREIIREQYAERSTEFDLIDFSEVFDDDPGLVYLDMIHTRQPGTDKVGQAIARHLIEVYESDHQQ